MGGVEGPLLFVYISVTASCGGGGEEEEEEEEEVVVVVVVVVEERSGELEWRIAP